MKIDDMEYAFTNRTVRELFFTEDIESCKAMNYIETLCGVLNNQQFH